eukprot:g10609.t1
MSITRVNEYTYSADLWSIGLVFSELLSGQWVMADLANRGSAEAMTKAMLDPTVHFDTVSGEDTDIPGLPDLINSMLRRVPESRASVQVLLAQIQGIMAEQRGVGAFSSMYTCGPNIGHGAFGDVFEATEIAT